MKNPGDKTIRDILQESKTIAVVGLSTNPEKDSYKVAQYLRDNGYIVIPVNPGAVEIMGLRSYPDLAAIPVKVDIVNVFRRSDQLQNIVKEALGITPRCIWSQLGVVDEKAAELAQEQDVLMIMDRCIKIEHQRLLRDS